MIAHFKDFLMKSAIDLTFVNDGSTDNTLDILNKLQEDFPTQVFIINQKLNTGKAEAVRNGILQAAVRPNCAIIGFMDADLATPFIEVEYLLNNFKNERTELVFGSRIARIGSKIKRLNYRHYGSRLVAKFASAYLNISIYDTQCGAKFFCKELATTVFREPFVSKWLFDIEIFKRIDLAGKDIQECSLEAPLRIWIEQGDSKIKLIDIVKIPFELYKIVRHYKPPKRDKLNHIMKRLAVHKLVVRKK